MAKPQNRSLGEAQEGIFTWLPSDLGNSAPDGSSLISAANSKPGFCGTPSQPTSFPCL